MRTFATYPLPRARSQAIPMGVYRRQLFVAQWRPRLVVALCALAAYPLVSGPWLDTPRTSLPLNTAAVAPAERPVLSANRFATQRPELAAAESVKPPEAPLEGAPIPATPPPPTPVGSAVTDMRGAGAAVATNVAIAISFVNGTVIEPGARFSFDDAARTWDFREDPRYVPGPATSSRGMITMRGGGVCWLSTAIWRAALTAGLATEFRENHFGLVELMGGGLDATNTLVIRNDTDVPVTVHAWIDRDDVHVALYADGNLGRTASIRGPQKVGSGSYIAYQDIVFDDGRTKTNQFISRYHW